jgi:hypothetical protein
MIRNNHLYFLSKLWEHQTKEQQMREMAFYRVRRFKYLTAIALGERRPEEVELMDDNDNRMVLSERPRRIVSQMRKIAGWLEGLPKKNAEGKRRIYTERNVRSFNNLKITVWPFLIELYSLNGEANDTGKFIFIHAKPKHAVSEFYKIANWLERV